MLRFSIFAFTPNARLFETASSGQVRRLLTIVYGTVAKTTQEPSLAGIPALSTGNFTLPLAGGSTGWRFCVTGQDCSGYIYEDIRGLFASVDRGGTYSIVVDGPLRGFLVPSEDSDTFAVSSDGSFFPVGYFVATTPRPTFTPRPTLTMALTPTDTFAESFGVADSDRHLAPGVPVASADCGHSSGIDATAGFTSSGNLGESHLGHSSAVECTARFEGTADFNPSPSFAPSELADSSTRLRMIVVGIVVPVAVALVAALIACRSRSRLSSSGDVPEIAQHLIDRAST
jgi:hypothetical protein